MYFKSPVLHGLAEVLSRGRKILTKRTDEHLISFFKKGAHYLYQQEYKLTTFTISLSKPCNSVNQRLLMLLPEYLLVQEKGHPNNHMHVLYL
jgi:hypothetical protein